MTKETRTCQSCQVTFEITDDDMQFYQMFTVPEQTWCPQCRWQRMLSWRGLRSLYKRPCNAPGHSETLISIFAPDSPATVYDHAYWFSDTWDAHAYGRAYDFAQPFFAQFRSLLIDVPTPNLVNTNPVNSDYCSSVLNMKNCYLVFAALDCENVLYGYQVDHSRDSLDVNKSYNNELCYHIFSCNKCYHVQYSAFCEQCQDAAFLIDCRGCSDCVGCVGLRNKQYYIFNTPYTQAEYEKTIAQWDLGSYSAREAFRKKFDEFRMTIPYRFARMTMCEDTIGDGLKNAKDCFYCFDAMGEDVEHCRYLLHPYGKHVRDCHTVFTASRAERCYESESIRDCHTVLFSKKIWTGHDIRYSYNCHSSSNLFGCAGLRNASYCILNQQYSKDDYERLVPQIVEHMKAMPYHDSRGRSYGYGEFFPPELSLFAYNESEAQEYFPLREDEARTAGFSWRIRKNKSDQSQIERAMIPDHINDATDDYRTYAFLCQHHEQCNHGCTGAFRIIPTEFQFYKRLHIPLPRLCPNCRHAARQTYLNPTRVWHRQCMCVVQSHGHANRCSIEFETTYAPHRPEIVYCESCYQSEVI